MNYKIINTGRADQPVPTMHGKNKNGVLGIEGQLGDKITVPGTARGEEKNFIIVSEEAVRVIFGLYGSKVPGVLDPEKKVDILIKNVKRNRALLEGGRLVVLDESGSHKLGIGTSEYQNKVVDATMQENQDLKDQAARFIDVMVAEGYSEEDARKILEGKIASGDAKLKKADGPRVTTGSGIFQEDGEKTPSTPEGILDVNGVIKVGDKEYKSVDGAMKKITALAGEAGSELQYTEEGMPFYEVGDETVTLG